MMLQVLSTIVEIIVRRAVNGKFMGMSNTQRLFLQNIDVVR